MNVVIWRQLALLLLKSVQLANLIVQIALLRGRALLSCLMSKARIVLPFQYTNTIQVQIRTWKKVRSLTNFTILINCIMFHNV